jgi:hypothetical protein
MPPGWVVRYIVPLFDSGFPNGRTALTRDEHLAMLVTARAAGPTDVLNLLAFSEA